MKNTHLGPWSAATILILIGALMAPPAAHAQSATEAPPVGQQQLAQEALQKEFLAESIVGQQEVASDRAFDPSFRAGVKERLAAGSLTELQDSLAAQSGLGPLIFGQSSNDIVFNPVPPCRIADTRVSGGPLVPGVQRNFLVAGRCGIPFGPATAVVINFVAVNPSGPGNLRAWPFGGTETTASIINYTAVPGLNIANGLPVPICDPAVSSCGADISVEADVSGTHLVMDVLGYFAEPVATLLDNNVLVTTASVAANVDYSIFSPPCPAGWRVSGGGGLQNFFSFPGPIGSRPAQGLSNAVVTGVNLADRWLVQGRNGPSSSTVFSFVVCARVPGR